MGYRTAFVYPAADPRTQRSLEVWLCYFLRPLLPNDVGWTFQEPPGELRVVLTWETEAQFRAWYEGDRCQEFRELHGGNRPKPRLRVPRRKPGRTSPCPRGSRPRSGASSR